MAHLREARSSRVTKRMCLSCGHRGRSLQGERGKYTFECPDCGADLYARPARSYAEMEGLVDAAERRDDRVYLIVDDQPRSTDLRRIRIGRRVQAAGFLSLGLAVILFVGMTIVG